MSGLNAPLNPGATDPRDLRLHNSPVVARSPARPSELAVASRVDGPTYSCALHHSRDGGRTWRELAIPLPQGEEPKCYAPDLVYDAAGTLYVAFVTLTGRGNVPHAGWVARMTAGEARLSAPIRSVGPLAFQVRLTADPVRPDHLHLVWVQAKEVGLFRFEPNDNPIQSIRSTDGGRSWSSPVRVSSPQRLRVLAPSPAVARDGRMFVLYLDLRDDRLDYEGGHEGQGGPPYPGPWTLVLSRSLDGGRTWEERAVDDIRRPISRIIPFIPAFPSLAVDRAGRTLYAAFHDARAGDPDVWLWRSGDAGRTWDGARRVNDTRPGDGTAQYLPRLGLSPDGRLDVVYYDRRADPDDVENEVSLQSAPPGGAFSRRLRLTDRSFDSRIGDGIDRDLPDLGSRLALLSTTSEALAVWSDTRAGRRFPRQDLGRAVVAVATHRHPRVGLLAPALLLCVLGGLVLSGLIQRRRVGDAAAARGSATNSE